MKDILKNTNLSIINMILEENDLPKLSIKAINKILNKLKSREELRKFLEACLTYHVSAFIYYLYSLAEEEIPQDLLLFYNSLIM